MDGFIRNKIRASFDDFNFHIVIFVLFIVVKKTAEGDLEIETEAHYKIELFNCLFDSSLELRSAGFVPFISVWIIFRRVLFLYLLLTLNSSCYQVR